MIKTDRQLAKTREQLALLERGLAGKSTPADGVHPVIADAGRRALSEQAEELREEIGEYEALRDGQATTPDLQALGELHQNLIRARIAQGLSQAELGRRLGIDAQQIQRYEATEYAGASLARLREIAAVLGATPVDETQTGAIRDEVGLVRRLIALGLGPKVARRLVPSADQRAVGFARTADLTARALGIDVKDLLAAEAPELAASRPGFKLPANATAAGVAAYATYARVLAGLVARATSPGDLDLPANPNAINAELVGARGASFRELLHYAWEHGIAVLPLQDPGAFHAAFWAIDGTNVVVLKQGARSNARWAFDLAHEMNHVADHSSQLRPLPDGVIDDETVTQWAHDPTEQRANRYAGRVVLGPRADDLAQQAALQADRRAERLKGAVQAVATREHVSVPALANYVAFRLAREGLNWWGAAANLQDRDEDPWRVARDVLLARLDFSVLDESSRGLLVQALADWTP